MELLALIIIICLFALSSNRKKKQKYYYDQPKKKHGCLKSFAVFFFILVVIVAVDSTDTSTSTSIERSSSAAQTQTTAAQDDPTPAPTAAPTLEPTEAPTSAPTAEPQTLQEWAEYVAQTEYGRFDSPYTNLISVTCEQLDHEDAPRITIYAKYPDSFMRDNDERMSGFLFSVMKVNWKLAELAKEGKIKYGSVGIHGRTTFIDKYGNESEGDAAQILIKASEAAKVNWSYSTVTGDMMPGIAVSFGIHPIIRDGLSLEYYSKIR